MNRIAKRSLVVILLTVLLLAGTSFFVAEYVTEAEDWAMFSGSPHVYSGSNIGSGVVTDKDGILLLNMEQGREYSSDEQIRKATLHWLGDRYGSISAPAIPHYAAQLSGFDLLTGLYSFDGSGGVARLTLSAQVQKVALEALGSRKGTVAVYNYQTGAILCTVTTPTYDPDNVPDIENDTQGLYEGAYMNRFTQSAYTPGSIFKIVTLAAALDCLPDAQEMTFTCTGSRSYGADKITCETAHGNQSLKQAFCNSCNCAFAELSEKLGAEKLAEYAQKLGAVGSVSFDGITTASGNFEAAEDAVNLGWSAIGQYTDLINPCAFLTFVGAVAGNGQGAIPYVVEQAGTYRASTTRTGKILSQEVTEIVRDYMRYTVENKYGDENFPGLTVCAKTGTAEKDGEQASNAMLVGFVDSDQYPLAFIVCVEEGGYGRSTCVPIASKVLSACVAALG